MTQVVEPLLEPLLGASALAAFDAKVQELAQECGVPGVSLALVSPAGEHFVNVGVTSVTNPLPVTSDTSCG